MPRSTGGGIFTPGEVYKRLRLEESQAKDSLSRRGCAHTRSVHAIVYKGVALDVTLCEDCGSIGKGPGVPTIGAWVPPTDDGNRQCRHMHHWRAKLYKGKQPLDAVWCEDCGSIGSTDLSEWVAPYATEVAPAAALTAPAPEPAAEPVDEEVAEFDAWAKRERAAIAERRAKANKPAPKGDEEP